jgi:hypothetical protein
METETETEMEMPFGPEGRICLPPSLLSSHLQERSQEED